MLAVLDQPEWRLAVALTIGLVIGAEREQRKRIESSHKFAGIRTFALVALTGGVAVVLGEYAAIAGFVVIGVLTIVAYARSDKSDPGTTTEVALILTYALGALSQSEPIIALGLGVVTTLLLAARAHLHRVIKEIISEQELLDALVFAVAAIVILPLVPNRTVDPWNSINPFSLWRLGVLVMAITGAGYIAVRWLGPRKGLMIAGFASGFVSSIATIHAMGIRAKEDKALEQAAISGASASSISTFVQLAIIIMVTNPTLIVRAWPILLTGGLAAAVYSGVQARQVPVIPGQMQIAGRALRWQSAVMFVVLVAATVLLSEALHRALGEMGALLGATVAGFADVHAAASAIATLTAEQKIDDRIGLLGLVLAISTNTLTKAGFALSSGSKHYSRSIVAGLVCVLAAVWLSYLILVSLRY